MSLKISYENTLDDFVIFQLHILKNNKKAYLTGKIISSTISGVITFIGIFLPILFSILLWRKDKILNIPIIIVFLCLGISMVICFKGFKDYDKDVLKKFKKIYATKDLHNMLGKKVLLLEDSTITITNTDGSHDTVIKESISKIESTEKYVYIFTSDITAYMIPKKDLLDNKLNVLISYLEK